MNLPTDRPVLLLGSNAYYLSDAGELMWGPRTQAAAMHRNWEPVGKRRLLHMAPTEDARRAEHALRLLVGEPVASENAPMGPVL